MTHLESKPFATGPSLGEEPPALADPDRLEANRSAFFAALGLPRSFFSRRECLVIGGTAESAVQYALWGARVCLIESDSARADAASRLFLRQRQTVRIESDSEMLEDPVRMARFEFVACEGTATPGSDPAAQVATVLRNVARGGVVLISMHERHGSLRRQLMQDIVRAFSKSREESEQHVREWFSSYCEAIARRRGIALESAMMELSLASPRTPLELSEICQLFSEHGMTYLGSNPRLGGLCRGVGTDPFDYLAHRDHYRFLERMWMAATSKTLEDWDRADPSAIASSVASEIDALEAVRERIARRDVDEVLIDRLRAGGLAFDRLTILASR